MDPRSTKRIPLQDSQMKIPNRQIMGPTQPITSINCDLYMSSEESHNENIETYIVKFRCQDARFGTKMMPEE